MFHTVFRFLRNKRINVPKGPQRRVIYLQTLHQKNPVPVYLALFGVSLTGVYEWFFGTSPNLDEVRKDIVALLESNPKYDDGSYGPVLVRLAWHASGTYDKTTQTGGSDGATMRFAPESLHAANAGLGVARDLLAPLQIKYPGLSTGDLWALAGCVAIEEMGGPKIQFRPGRIDKSDKFCPPDGRLPDASQGASHIRDIFYRQGFNDQEIVALIGAHCLGRCHTNRTGFDGPWTNSPTTFSNAFFTELLSKNWKERKWSGPFQYSDGTGLMMLPADKALLDDPEFKKWVKVYAEDEDRFFQDFSKAFQKLLENGCTKLACPVQQPKSQ